MDLPHRPPIRFVQKVLHKEKNHAVVNCVFKHKPTLGMSIEAAAQASAVFAKQPIKGMLAGAQQVVVHCPMEKTHFQLAITRIHILDNMSLFSFSIEHYVTGKIVIYAE